MFIRTPYWYFKNAVDSFFIKALTEATEKEKTIRGKIDGTKVNLKRRESDVKFISQQWVYDALMPYIRTANQSAKWDYDFNYCESAQYTIYKKGQHYGWHTDMADDPYDMEDTNFKGKVRKLSCTLLLNDAKEFKGGDFEFDLRNIRDKENIVKVTELKNKGDLIVFPSHLWHRVKPVISGKRLSLVVWFIGPPFK